MKMAKSSTPLVATAMPFLIILITFLYGYLGIYADENIRIYCALSKTITRTECPPKAQPVETARFNANAFKTLTFARNRVQVLFGLLSFLSFPNVIVGLLSFLSIFLAFIVLYATSIRSREPPDTTWRQKLDHWSRLLIASPANFLAREFSFG